METPAVSMPSGEPASLVDNAAKPSKVNRGKKGGRLRVVAARVSPQEFAVLDERARDAGLSIGSYLRTCGLGSTGPRARRSPPLNAELLAYAIAQLNRVGANLNQITRRLNAADSLGANDSASAVAETREAVRQICEILGRKNRHDRQGNHTL
jgi:hypothetical protein